MNEQKLTTFVLAGGCFWCLDAAYRVLKGVIKVESLYTGGSVINPSYEQVCTGLTGHAEAVAVTFDTEKISPEIILDAYFTMHDPTELNKQGGDIGTQYRSAMFYANNEQKQLFEDAKKRAAQWWGEAIVTSIEKLQEQYPAEDYHQDFFANNPDQAYCLAVAVPKVMKIRQGFAEYIRA